MGYMPERSFVRVAHDAIDPQEVLSLVADPAAGGTCLFVGTVRDHSEAGIVTGLHYEAWEELVGDRLELIAAEIFGRWPVCKVALVHRVGDLAIGEVSVAVACSAGHRAEAFDACRHGIERIKEDAPIWKKESLTTGDSHWVAGS
jgi:molybdopterin synthase catalytic subunit